MVKNKPLKKVSKAKVKVSKKKIKKVRPLKKVSKAKRKVPKAKRKISKVKRKVPKVKRKIRLKNNNLRSRPKVINKIVKDSKGILRQTGIIKKLPRAGTGIHGFDKLIEGGFERESINLVVGGSGSGKSIFAIQFLMEGIRKGETVLYVTFEEKKIEVFRHMKKMGWDLERLEKSGKFIFLEYSPEKVKMTLDEGGGTIESMVLRHKITRMVMDSITSFSLLFDDPLSKKQANLGLFDIINKWKTTTLLTVQQDPLRGKGDELSSIEFEVDSITLLYFTKIKGKRQRYLEVLKMRGTNHSKQTYTFEIKNGLVLGSYFRDCRMIFVSRFHKRRCLFYTLHL